MAMGDIQVHVKVSTWRLTAVLWVLQVALWVLPLRLVAPVVEAFTRAMQRGERLFHALVRVRVVEDAR